MKTRRLAWRCWGAVCAATMGSLFACGGDDFTSEPGPPDASAGSGGTAGSGSGGTSAGGASGTAGTSGTGGSTGGSGAAAGASGTGGGNVGGSGGTAPEGGPDVTAPACDPNEPPGDGVFVRDEDGSDAANGSPSTPVQRRRRRPGGAHDPRARSAVYRPRGQPMRRWRPGRARCARCQRIRRWDLHAGAGGPSIAVVQFGGATVIADAASELAFEQGGAPGDPFAAPGDAAPSIVAP